MDRWVDGGMMDGWNAWEYFPCFKQKTLSFLKIVKLINHVNDFEQSFRRQLRESNLFWPGCLVRVASKKKNHCADQSILNKSSEDSDQLQWRQLQKELSSRLKTVSKPSPFTKSLGNFVDYIPFSSWTYTCLKWFLHFIIKGKIWKEGKRDF